MPGGRPAKRKRSSNAERVAKYQKTRKEQIGSDAYNQERADQVKKSYNTAKEHMGDDAFCKKRAADMRRRRHAEKQQNKRDLGSCSNVTNGRKTFRSVVPIAGKQEGLAVLCALHLKYSNLQDDNIEPCKYCGARLFHEERSRTKWCCGQGSLLFPKAPPLEAAFYQKESFLKNVRSYNNLFAFSALGVTGGFQRAPNGRGTSMVKIQGKIYHRIFDLSWSQPGCPNNTELYIDDGQKRMSTAKQQSLDVSIVTEIQNYLQQVNSLCPVYKQLGAHDADNAHIVFERTSRAKHGPVLGDRPVSGEIAGIIKTQSDKDEGRKVSVWKKSQRRPQFISILDSAYEPLQYPLIFPHATAGWFPGMLSINNVKVSQTKYYRQLLLSDDRMKQLGRLAQEYFVDAWSRAQEEKLMWIRREQPKLRRSASRKELDETIAGEGGLKAGKIYLPSSFTGGPRNMQVKYQNAMAVVARKGKPSFFITMTTNPKWKEITDNLLPHQSASDRPDLCDRVFHCKKSMLMEMINSGKLFGPRVSVMHVIEFQKRGLPHAHIALRVAGGGPVHAHEIDSFVRATLPDETEANGKLLQLVVDHMIHGPCGFEKPDSPCNEIDEKSKRPRCTKDYPKAFNPSTHTDDRGYVLYKRPDDGRTAQVTRNYVKYTVDNRYVVPYNPALLLLLECHCNVEIATNVRIIKYLYKYITKGPDRSKATIVDEGEEIDEIKDFQTWQHLTVSEAMWRTLEFDTSGQYPPVKALPVHLQGEESIVFDEGNEAEALEKSVSKLDLYMNRPGHPDLDELTYLDFYERYSITTSQPRNPHRQVFLLHTGKHWCALRVGEEAVARMHWVSPANSELFYMRMLLSKIPARGYRDLLSYEGQEYGTFQEVAKARGLLTDENEYREAIVEAKQFKTGNGLRQLFVSMIICEAAPRILWDEFKSVFAEDFLDRDSNEERAYNDALCSIDHKLRKHGKSLAEVGLPQAIENTTEIGREILRWNRDEQTDFVSRWLPLLSDEQRAVFDFVVEQTECATEKRLAFVDGPSGTGKTLLFRVIEAHLRSKGEIVLPVASTGNAALNHEGGTTAHAMFKLPIQTTDPHAYCDLSANSQRTELIKKASLIIWDEAPMSHRHNMETLDRTLQDFIVEKPFGNKPVVMGGDRRQILPVVRYGSKQDVLKTCVNFSPLWKNVKIFQLTEAQRDKEDPEYSQFVRQIGEDTIEKVVLESENGSDELVPLNMVQAVDDMDSLIDFVYDEIENEASCINRAILSGTNANIQELNEKILDRLPGDAVELLSADSCVEDETDPDQRFVPTEILHNLSEPGVPNHSLKLKVGCICIVIRNLSFDDGLVNGSKVVIRSISTKLIAADLLRDGFPPKQVLFPRITFRFKPDGSSLTVRRRQFPLKLAYSLTFNKAQGQTLEKVGLDLRDDVFAHGQLYVALGRVRNRNSIRVIVPPHRIIGPNNTPTTKNIVYREAL